MARVLLMMMLSVAPTAAQGGYRSHSGLYTRKPHVYKRHPNAGTAWTATCRDGSVSFSRSHHGACARHGGVKAWRELHS